VVAALTGNGIGQSTCVGIGGDPIIGSSFVDILALFEQDHETKAVVLIGEIGGTEEEAAAQYVSSCSSKPVVAFIAGRGAPPERRMGHAGALIAAGGTTAEKKMQVLREHGVLVTDRPGQIPEYLGKIGQLGVA
jgi:succinyl-CoA synthetase alpha subunit